MKNLILYKNMHFRAFLWCISYNFPTEIALFNSREIAKLNKLTALYEKWHFSLSVWTVYIEALQETLSYFEVRRVLKAMDAQS